jgi:hypothetical protein
VPLFLLFGVGREGLRFWEVDVFFGVSSEVQLSGAGGEDGYTRNNVMMTGLAAF